MASKGRFGRILLLLGVALPLEFILTTVAVMLNHCLDVGPNFGNLPASIKMSLVLFPFVPSILAAGSCAMRRAGVTEWYHHLSGKQIAETGEGLFYASFIFFAVMTIIIDRMDLGGIIVVTLALVVALGVLNLINNLIMVVLGVSKP